MKMQDTILVVDDIEMNRMILSEIFRDKYKILEAENGAEALAVVKARQESIAIILLDVVMPVMDGFEVLRILSERKMLDKIPVILVTGDTSENTEKKGYDTGVSDIIIKPFDSHIIRRRVDNIIELYRHKNKLESLVEEQTKRLSQQNAILMKQAVQLQEMNNHIIDAMSNIVEFRNMESGTHVKRIKKFTKCMAECIADCFPEYGLDAEKIRLITQSSAMHDIGKIVIPDSILLKPGKLTKEEFEVMKTHTVRGCELMRFIADIQDAAFYRYSYDICRYHHERYDGRGYPDGLIGEEIPIAAQIVSLADVYDALVSDRVYKKAFDKDTAYHMIMNGECGTFSPKILECFEKCRPQFERMADEGDVANE